MKINELITIKQLPIIEQMLDKISVEIEKKTSKVSYISEGEPKEILRNAKKLRADLNKYFISLEERRKVVKTSIQKPYIEFEKIYKKKITEKFKKADEILKVRIDEIVSSLKKERIKFLEEYFIGQCESSSINFLKFEDMNLKINLSDSLKSQFEQIRVFVENVKNGLEIINNEKNENRRLDLIFEFRKNFNLASAFEAIKKKEEQLSQHLTTENNVVVPIHEVKKYSIHLNVRGSKEQLRKLKEYIKKLEIEIL